MKSILLRQGKGPRVLGTQWHSVPSLLEIKSKQCLSQFRDLHFDELVLFSFGAVP